MKRSLYLLFLPLTLVFTSCLISEDVSFLEDGKVKYNISFDMSEALKAIPSDELGTLPADSVIHIGELISKNIVTDSISAEYKEDLQNISPFYLRIVNNDADKTATMSLYGDFDNVEALNKAFLSMNRIKETNKTKITDGKNSDMLMEVGNQYLYSWDGKTMNRTVLNPQNKSDESNEQNQLANLLSNGKMTVKYHFPKKAKDVNNPDAFFSQDGKTVIVEYPSSAFAGSPQNLNIEIITE